MYLVFINLLCCNPAKTFALALANFLFKIRSIPSTKTKMLSCCIFRMGVQLPRLNTIALSDSSCNNLRKGFTTQTSSGGGVTPASSTTAAAEELSSPPPRRLTHVRRSNSNKFFMVGVPLIIFCLGGYVFLAEFMKTHVEVKDQKQKATSNRVFEIEEEYNSIMKGLDIDNYKLSAIPRPGESVKQPKKKITVPMVKPTPPS